MQNDAPAIHTCDPSDAAVQIDTAIESAISAGRLAKISTSPGNFAWIGFAPAGGPRFDPEDDVHQGPDALRWAEWIRDARELQDFDRSDSIRAVVASLGEVRILQGGHVIVIEKIGSNPKHLVDQFIHSLVSSDQPAGGDHAPRH